MKATLEVLAHPTSDTQGSAFTLVFESQRYVFGHAFEGLQRQFLERRSRYRNVDKLFLTGPLNWQHLGGLPGLALTLADQRENGHFGVWSGAESILYGIAAWRSFLFRPGGMRLVPHVWGEDLSRCRERQQKLILPTSNNNDGYQHLHECPDRPHQQAYVDVNVCIEPVILPDPSTHSSRELLSVQEKDKFANIAESLFSGVDNAKPLPRQLLPKSKPDNVSTSYIIQVHPMRGSFHPEKAKQLGVPSGPLFAHLANGRTITTPNGDVVYPHQVMGEPRRGPRILVVDCPNEKYLNSVLDNPQWKAPLSWTWDHSSDRAIINKDTHEQTVDYVIHLLGADVDPLSDRYKSWLGSFGPDTRHLFGHPDFCPDNITLNKLSASILKLREIAPNHFPLWYSADAPRTMPQTIVEGGTEQTENLNQQQPQCLPLLAGQEIGLFPTRSFDESNVWERGAREWDKFHATHVSPMQDKLSYHKEKAQKLQEQEEAEVGVNEYVGSQVEVTTLGTGSCMPSSYRNVSGTLVRIPAQEAMNTANTQLDGTSQGSFSILLDCGESTAGTLRRIYGTALDSILKELKVIYISHLHADHHLGLVSVIRDWCEANRDRSPDCKLFVIGPYQIQAFIEEWNTIDVSLDIDRVVYIRSPDLLPDRFDGRNQDLKTDLARLGKETGISRILTNKARHAPFSFTVVFEFESSFKMAYSGDTKPSQAFIDAGKNCTLLVHEATLDNELFREAEVKGHCTLSQAACVARCMEARVTVLTHFSQRYPKLPALEVLKTDQFFQKSTIAYPFNDKEIKEIVESACTGDLKIPEFVCGFDTFRVTLRHARAAGKWQSALPLVFIDDDMEAVHDKVRKVEEITNASSQKKISNRSQKRKQAASTRA